MSTRLTDRGIPMQDSRSLQLVFTASQLDSSISSYVTNALHQKGYAAITPALLSFISALDCGINYGSEIARSMGVSRQFVARTVKELSEQGYLEQVDGVGKQKQILFTEKGEHLISDARRILAELDERFAKELGTDALGETISQLVSLQKIIDTLSK